MTISPAPTHADIVLRARISDFRRVTPAQEARAVRKERQTRLQLLSADLILLQARRAATRGLPRVAGAPCGCTLDHLCPQAARLFLNIMELGPHRQQSAELRTQYEAHRALFGGRVSYHARVLPYARRDAGEVKA